MYGLHAIAEQPNLTPWVRKLTVTCNILYGTYGNLDDLSLDAIYEMDCVLEREQGWIPNAPLESLEVNNVMSESRKPWTETNSVTRTYAPNMHKTLKVFLHIEEVASVWDIGLLPQRYKKARLLDSDVYLAADGVGPAARGAHLGLAVTFEALANAGIQPKSLNLAVEMENPDRFILTITKTAFPFLNSLVIDHGMGEIECEVVVPAPTNTPKLRSLSIINGGLLINNMEH